MIPVNSLDELPIAKHHSTPGDVRRDDTDAYEDLGEILPEPEDEQETEA